MTLVLDLLAGGKTVNTGHNGIEQDQRRMVFFDGFDGFDTIGGLNNIEFFRFQHMADHQSN